jgi:glutaredoxin
MSNKKRILFRIEGCPYCERAEQALDSAGISYDKIEVAPYDRSLIQILSSQPTVPILVEVIGSSSQDDEILAYIEDLQARA